MKKTEKEKLNGQNFRRGYQTGYKEGKEEAETKLTDFASRLSALEEEMAKIKKFLII